VEILLIDIGALAVFLGYVATVYWHGVSHAPACGNALSAKVHERGQPALPSRSASACRS